MTKETKADILKRRKGGRPREYDPDILAEELIEWAEDEDSINMAQFCADRGYLPSLIWRLELEYEEFSRAYQLAKLRLAERRERLFNANLLHYATFQRYQAGYDAFLTHAEDSEKDKEAARRKGIVQAEHKNFIELTRMIANGEIKQKD